MHTFPKLDKVGYELLIYQRGGSGSGFYNLAPHIYSQEVAARHAKIFIRPLQKELEVDDMTSGHVVEVEPILGYIYSC